jgi:hypothetical protein
LASVLGCGTSLYLIKEQLYYLRAPCFCRILVDNSARMIEVSLA